mmetsp:Transcript_37239/g.93512  ORF Transcript_37239/g.93512 Transcript_37239/m.93512 type:complete len:468 (+) Transcript_37239:193-1596(+)
MAAVGGTDELTEARGKLRAAEEELSDAKKELVASKADRDAPRIAEAKVGVAEAKVGVAEAKVGVAEAKVGVAEAGGDAARVAEAKVGVAKAEWQAAPGEKEKDRLWTLVQSAQAALEALHAATQHHGLGLQPGTGETATLQWQLFMEEQREQERKREKRDMQIFAALEASRPPSVHGSITPSSAAQGRENEFYNLIDQMGLSWPPEISDMKCDDQPEETSANFSFSWKTASELSTHLEELSVADEDSGATTSHADSGLVVEEEASQVQNADAREAASYHHLCAYLKGKGFNARVVANGQGLPNGLLFSTYAHSMRLQVPKVKGQTVYAGMRVYGRTDVVILDDLGKEGDVRRQRVKLGIEVKPPDKIGRTDDAQNPANREAATQLIGLNINNMRHSPPVLLTNLSKVHWVFYISDHEEYPWFRMARKKFTRFIDAMQFIEKCIWASDKPHYDFGRGASPTGGESISA